MARDDEIRDLYLAIKDANDKIALSMASAAMAIKMIEIHQVACIGRQSLIDLYLKIIMGMLTTFIMAGLGIAAALATKFLGG